MRRFNHFFILHPVLLVSIFSLFFCLQLQAYELIYQVEFQPQESGARVTLNIPNNRDADGKPIVRELSFKRNKKVHSEFKANGRLKLSSKKVRWRPPAGNASLSLQVNLLHERDSGEYDSYINKDWALFRGDDLFPSSSVKTVKNAQSYARLEFILPDKWASVNTRWQRDKQRPGFNYIVEDSARKFDRPTGWMIAGKIASRREYLGETYVSISGPKRSSLDDSGVGLKRMEIMTFLHFVWPQVEKLFSTQVQKLLIVGAAEPMWRGGLSGPYSMFVHADRPLVSENGTSTILHELFHSLTRIRGEKYDDWIAEGLAEYYSIMWLYRSGGMSERRFLTTRKNLQIRSKKIKKLRKKRSSGATTAKAVLFFFELDEQIQTATKNKASLNDVVKKLLGNGKISVRELEFASKSISGKELEVFKKPIK